MKQVTVLGANGKVGSLVVAKALQRGYRVVAFVHSNRGDMTHTNLTIIEGDVHDEQAVGAAIQGSSAVISALGSWGTPTKDILQAGMQSLIPSMQTQGVKRVISLTGSEARASGDRLSLIHRLAHAAASLLAGKILDDGEAHISLLEKSGLDWTTVRSPVMTESGSREYRLGMKRPMPWATIHRHAVATAMVAMLDDKSYVGQAPFINR